MITGPCLPLREGFEEGKRGTLSPMPLLPG